MEKVSGSLGVKQFWCPVAETSPAPSSSAALMATGALQKGISSQEGLPHPWSCESCRWECCSSLNWSMCCKGSVRWVWEALVAGGSPNSSNSGDVDEFPARGLSQTPGQAG